MIVCVGCVRSSSSSSLLLCVGVCCGMCGVLWYVVLWVCVRVGGVGVHGILCVYVCLKICGSMNIGIYMCGVSVCIGVYECPCRCLSVCLSFCLSVCLSLVDVVVSLLLSMSMCVSIMVRVGRVGLRVFVVAVVVVAVFLVKKTLCVCVCIVHV